MDSGDWLARLARAAASARGIEVAVRSLTPEVCSLEHAEAPEVNANLMLAIRHLEDAQGRLELAASWATYHEPNAQV